MEWYLKVLRNYAVFDGRAQRSEYWYFVLFNFIISLVLGLIDGMAGTMMTETQGILGSIYSLAVLVPSIAVGVRRMHDTDHSGWFILVPIYNLYLACIAGTEGKNRFGSDPLNPDADDLSDHLVD